MRTIRAQQQILNDFVVDQIWYMCWNIVVILFSWNTILPNFFCRFETIRLNEGSKSADIVCLWNNQYWVAAAMVACNWNSELYEILLCIWYYGVIYIDFPPIMNQPKPKLWFKLNIFQGNGTKWKFWRMYFELITSTHTYILE